MTVINLSFTYGIIDPSSNLNCKQSLGVGSLPPLISSYFKAGTIEEIGASAVLEENSRSFWKMRTWLYFITVPRFCSLAFLPFDRTSIETLLVQKNGGNFLFEKSYAPYFSESDQKKLKCISTAEKVYNIFSVNELIEGIEGLDDGIYSGVVQLLEYFLQDVTSQVLGLTYEDEKDEQKTLLLSK